MTGHVFMKSKVTHESDRRTVLIVEDSPFILRAMTSALESMEYEIKSTNAPDVALSMYHNDPRPDLMILDHHLGVGMMTGLDMLAHMDHEVPIIMHTSDMRIKDKAVKLGVEFVPKSNGLNGLMDMVRVIMISDSQKQSTKQCYACDEQVNWLAPDGRCYRCTRSTIEEIQG